MTNVINGRLFGLIILYSILNGVGSLFYNMGLQKLDKENTNLLKLNKSLFKSLWNMLTNKQWFFGAFLATLGFIVYQFALKDFDVSVVKALVNLNIIFVIIFGTKIMKDKMSKYEWLGIIFLILGAVTISLYSQERKTSMELDRFWVFTTILFILLLIVEIVIQRALKKDGVQAKKTFEIFASISCGTLYGMGAIYNKSLYAQNISPALFYFSLSLFALTYTLAFFHGQAAYLHGRMSIISSVVNIFIILLPFLGGFLIFGDPLILSGVDGIAQYVKIIGLILIILGIFFTSYSDKGKIKKLQ